MDRIDVLTNTEMPCATSEINDSIACVLFTIAESIVRVVSAVFATVDSVVDLF